MARPRLHTDDDLLDAVERVITRTGGAPWSLAQVATEAGVTAPALSRRFGSRSGLLLALGERWVAAVPVRPVGDLEPWDELRAWVRESWAPVGQGRAGSLAALAADLADPVLTDVLRRGWRARQGYVAALVAAASPAHAPPPGDAATVLLGLLEGCALRWSVDPDGRDLLDLLALALTTLLDGWTRP